jgi:hypothetical protein
MAVQCVIDRSRSMITDWSAVTGETPRRDCGDRFGWVWVYKWSGQSMEQPKADTSYDNRSSQTVVQVGGEWLRVDVKATIGLSSG